MLYIHGSWKKSESGKTFVSRNPATVEALGEAADGTRKDAAAAI